MQRAMGTGTLEVPKQSILNLLFPGHTRCSGCVHSSATAQAVGTEFRASSRLVAALAAGRGVCVPWLAGRWLPGDRIPQPTPQDVNLDPDLPCCVSPLLALALPSSPSPAFLVTAHTCQWHPWPSPGCAAASQLACSLLRLGPDWLLSPAP